MIPLSGQVSMDLVSMPKFALHYRYHTVDVLVTRKDIRKLGRACRYGRSVLMPLGRCDSLNATLQRQPILTALKSVLCIQDKIWRASSGFPRNSSYHKFHQKKLSHCVF